MEAAVREVYPCQSCGMPMAAEEHFGTQQDGSHQAEYCCYCYQNGRFTDDVTMDQMIASSLDYPDALKTADGRVLSKREAALKMRLQLVTLKRWMVNEHTQNVYFHAVNKVVDYIHRHLPEAMDLSMLANVANISRFHFHRIFKAIMDESLGEYIQRIRLESVAFKLQTTGFTLDQIAEQTGYQSQFALSKSFKKYFKIAPSLYRRQPSDLSVSLQEQECATTSVPEIRTIDSKEVVYICVVDPHENPNAFIEAWRKLIHFTKSSGIPDHENEYISLSRDISPIIKPEHLRIYACMSISRPVKPTGVFGVQTIESGQYAVFTHKGSYRQLSDLYCYIFRCWLLGGAYQVRNCTMFEKYLNTPDKVKEEELLTEVWIPVADLE